MYISRCFELLLTDRKSRGCSEATLVFYDYVIGKFIRCIEKNDLDSSSDLRLLIISLFINHLVSVGVACN
jgi:hypothetical protein